MKAFSLTRFTSGWIAALLLLVLTGCGSDSNPINPTAARSNLNQVNAANSAVPNHVFSATLTGAEAVPLVNTAATATGVVVVDPVARQMKATVVTADIAGTAAYIQVAPRGVSGPVVLQLTESSGGSGIWTASTVLSAEQLDMLRSGSYYFNVHSTAFPDGEIRGQILVQLPKSGSAIPASGTGTTISSSGTTNGAATGTSTVTTSGGASTGGTVVSGTADTTTPNATTSGNTAKSVNTGTMSSSSINDNASALGASGTTSGSTSGVTSTGSGLATTTGTTVAATRPLFFTNVMTGALAVPPTSSTATATTITVYRPRDRVLTSVIVSSGITGTGASLRQGAAGAVGPVINSLRETTPGSGIWIARTTLTSTQGTALTGGNMYYEITSTAFLQGELRGQIVATAGTKRAASAATPGTATTTTTGGTTGTATGTTTNTGSNAGTTGTTTGTAAPTTTVTPMTTTSGVGTTTPGMATSTGPTGVISSPASST